MAEVLRGKKTSVVFEGRDLAGCFFLNLSLIEFDRRDALFTQYLAGSNVFGKVACFSTIAPGFMLPLEKHQGWERSIFSEQSPDDSKAVGAVL